MADVAGTAKSIGSRILRNAPLTITFGLVAGLAFAPAGTAAALGAGLQTFGSVAVDVVSAAYQGGAAAVGPAPV